MLGIRFRTGILPQDPRPGWTRGNFILQKRISGKVMLSAAPPAILAHRNVYFVDSPEPVPHQMMERGNMGTLHSANICRQLPAVDSEFCRIANATVILFWSLDGVHYGFGNYASDCRGT